MIEVRNLTKRFDGFAALELKKIHDHREPLFFDWLRTGVFGDADSNLKKPAKK